MFGGFARDSGSDPGEGRKKSCRSVPTAQFSPPMGSVAHTAYLTFVRDHLHLHAVERYGGPCKVVDLWRERTCGRR